MKQLFIIFLSATGMFYSLSCFASDETLEKFHFLLNGIKSEREKLVSGVVRGKGETSFSLEESGKVVEKSTPVEYFVAFDFLKENMRVDRKEPLYIGDDYVLDMQMGHYIETKDKLQFYAYSVEKQNDYGPIYIADSKEGDYEMRGTFCGPLDMRSIGLVTLHRLQSKTPFLPDLIERHLKRTPNVLVEEENGIWRFEYHQRVEERGELRKVIIWIDSKQGYTVKRTKSVWEFDHRQDEPWILDDHHISWKEINGVWVPIDISYDLGIPVNKKEKFVMTFDWENVNEPVDEEFFSYCDFDAPESTPVYEAPRKGSDGEPKRLGSYLDLCGSKEGRLLMKELAEKRGKSSSQFRRRFLLIGVSLIVVAAALRYLSRQERGRCLHESR